jgi:MFS family permease
MRVMPRTEPSRLYRWMVLTFVSLAMFGNYYAFDALNPVGPLLESQLGFTQAQIGLLDTAYNIAALLVLLAGGVIIDRAGTKRAMIAFGSINALGAFIIAFASSPITMASGRFVMGVGAEPLIVAATTVLGRWFKGKELGFAMGINLMIARFGSVAADNSRNFASGLFYSWQPPLILAGFVACACIIGAVVYAILERRAEREFPRDTSLSTDKLVVADLVRFDRSYWYVVGLCVTFYSAMFPFRRFANIFFVDAHGASPEQAAFFNGLLPLTAMFATPLFGLLVDKIGRRSLLMTVGSLLLFPAFLLRTAYALMTFCQQIGWGVMAWAIGRVNDASGAGSANPAGYIPGMWMFAALGFMGLFFSFLLWRSEKGPRAYGLETIRA